MKDRYNHPYYIIHLVKHGRGHFGQTPAQEAENQTKMNDFIKTWAPELEQVMAFHCMGLASDWDWIGIFGVTDLSVWVGFRETLTRLFPGHIEKFLSLPSVSHDLFTKGTQKSSYYQKLRALGSFPGGAEV